MQQNWPSSVFGNCLEVPQLIKMDKDTPTNHVHSLSGLHYVPIEPTSGGEIIGAQQLQQKAINKTMHLLGSLAWLYGYKSKWRYDDMAYVLEEARVACGYPGLQYKTFLQWLQHYLKHGEMLHETNRWQMKAKTKQAIQKRTTFDAEDDVTLKCIINQCPQYFLDEIKQALLRERSKWWDESTIWWRLHHLGYSLQVAVFCAAQEQSKLERKMC